MLGDKLSTKKLRCTPLGWRIRDDALQQSFRAKYPAMCVAPAKVYSVFWVLASGWSMVAYLGHPLTPAFYGLFVPLAVGILLYLSSLHPFTKRHMELLLTIAVVLLVLWNGGMFFIHMDYWYSQYTGQFNPETHSPAHMREMRSLCKDLVTITNSLFYIILLIPQLIVTVYLTADQAVTLLTLAVSCVCMLAPHVHVWNATYCLLVVCNCIVLFGFGLAFYFKRFLMLHHLAEKEVEMSYEASRKADSMLNHSLKNRMADAAGEVELFLETYTGPHAVLLECVASLRRGMQLCQHRQAYVDLAAGRYAPRLTPSSVQEFGSALAAGRKLLLREFCRVRAAFDTIACEMILENALSNAFKHGCPQDAQVAFIISHAPSDAASHARLVFRVTNRAHPDRPALTDAYIRNIVTGVHCDSARRMPATSDHAGLSHCYTIAEACDIELSLTQEGDLVTFEARVNAEVEGGALAEEAPALPALVELPPGLVYHVLDDSAVARRLVVSQLLRFVQPAAVRAFGATPAEVEEFLPASLEVADVVIMDENLEYDGARYLGSDLLEQFKKRGFCGLLCTRSANCSAADREKYLRKGAHCILMKDMTGKEMARSVGDAYAARRLAAQAALADMTSVDTFVGVGAAGALSANASTASVCSGHQLKEERGSTSARTSTPAPPRRTEPAAATTGQSGGD